MNPLDVREFVDPGIGGRMTTDENGAKIQKFNPAQPQLFATLIQGIMARDLPWGLVIIGAVLAIVMQLCGVSALAFAVGVYLPLSTTLPIFVGGMVRKVVDKARRIQRRRGGHEPRHLDVDRLDRGRLARRHHRRVPDLLPGPEGKARLRGAAGRRRIVHDLGAGGVLGDGGGPAGGGLLRQAADLGRSRGGRQASARRDRRIGEPRLNEELSRASPAESATESHQVIGLLLAFSALAIVIDPARAPLVLIVVLLVSARSLFDAWQAVRGTALRARSGLGDSGSALAVIAQAAALAQPLASGRPLAERFTYLSVLALLAALGSVLNARTPGGKAWAGLMVVLVVVFLIPWLEDQTRLRRATPLCPASPRCALVDFLWTAGRGRGDELPAHPLRAGGRRPGRAVHPRIPRALAESLAGFPARRRSGRGSAGRWPWPWRSRAGAPASTEARSRCERLWFWFRDNWGVVWALRVLERFNRAAEVSHWPVRLTWFGLVPVAAEPGASPAPSPEELEATFRNLMKRFAQSWRLDRVTEQEPSRRTG